MTKHNKLHLGSRTFLEPHEIVFLYSHGNYTKVCMPNGEVITVSTNLGKIEGRLPEINFVRVHRSYIINLDFMVDLNTSNLVLSNSVTINISRRKRTEVKKKIKGTVKFKELPSEVVTESEFRAFAS